MKKAELFKRCQFRTVLSGKRVKEITRCDKPAIWDVFQEHDVLGRVLVGHVCGDHALAATHGGFKIG